MGCRKSGIPENWCFPNVGSREWPPACFICKYRLRLWDGTKLRLAAGLEETQGLGVTPLIPACVRLVTSSGIRGCFLRGVKGWARARCCLLRAHKQKELNLMLLPSSLRALLSAASCCFCWQYEGSASAGRGGFSCKQALSAGLSLLRSPVTGEMHVSVAVQMAPGNWSCCRH